jgi:hypothetical protein
MQSLRAAVLELEALEEVDPRELSELIDRLQAVLCRVVRDGVRRGDHLLEGKTANAWVRSTCRLTSSSAADRLCVGEQLEQMPRVAQAVRSGEIGYQAASVICHFRDRLGEDLRPNIDEDWWVEQARDSSIKNLRWLEEHTRYVVDPDSFDRQVEEDWEKRFLSISESGGMFHLTGVLDREGGSALETAIESLSKRLGDDDGRTPKQRRADALTEIVHHAMDKGTLPRRHGVRPHISVHTTPEALEGRLGAPLSELGNGVFLPGSPRCGCAGQAAQRLACDGTLHRVLKAGSLVIDVGRAHRTAQPAHWRGLKARHKTCAAPGCDRPLSWTQAHHVEFWEHGGHTNLHKMLPLCFHHHRLVHEGGWQVVLVGDRLEFIPPEAPVVSRRRWGERRWAA